MASRRWPRPVVAGPGVDRERQTRVLGEVRGTGARRVVIDGIDAFRQAMVFPGRLKPFFTALSRRLAGGKNSRLYRRLVYELQIADDVSAFQNGGKLGGEFQISATARTGRTLAELEALERAIAAHPDQWVMFQNVWPSEPVDPVRVLGEPGFTSRGV